MRFPTNKPHFLFRAFCAIWLSVGIASLSFASTYHSHGQTGSSQPERCVYCAWATHEADLTADAPAAPSLPEHFVPLPLPEFRLVSSLYSYAHSGRAPPSIH